MKPGSQVDELARAVIGSAIEVHRELGPGYSEAVYEEALAREFFRAGIGFERQKSFKVRFRGPLLARGVSTFWLSASSSWRSRQSKIGADSQVSGHLLSESCRLSIGFVDQFQRAFAEGGVQRVVFTIPDPALAAWEKV